MLRGLSAVTPPPCPRCETPRPSGEARFCAHCGQRFDQVGGDDPLIGSTLLGRYRVEVKLGEGSMGRVYLGEQRVGEGVRRVAIKVLAAARGNDEYIVSRFRREATTLASLEHPNIVRLFDYGEEGGRFVSVMEFVPGESLATRVQRGRLEPTLALDLATQMASALDAAHKAGIVHRDLKPENVLLSPGDPIPLLKVVDFGIARRQPAHPGEKPLTSLGTVLGTPAFMCPEQLRGQPVDARADVYSLGLLTYLMLSGTLPWPARSLVEWTDAHLNVPPTPLRQQSGCKTLPASVEAAINHALAKDAAHRTPSAMAFLTELRGEAAAEDAVSNVPVGSVATVSIASVPVPPLNPAYASRSWPPPRPRRRVLPWVLGVAAASILGGFAVVSLALHGSRAPSPVPANAATAPRPPVARPHAATAAPSPAPAPAEDHVARASEQAQAAARNAVRDGLERVRLRDLDGAVAALTLAREPPVLPTAEVDPLREGVDRLGAERIRQLIHVGDCHRVRAVLSQLQRVGAAAASRPLVEESTCRRHH